MKTDNSYIDVKISLRRFCIQNSKNANILELFAGSGKIYSFITDLDYNILSIEKERNKHKTALIGDNLKFIKNFDLSRYNIIDCDSYGIPFEQLEIILNSDFKGYIIVTYIQSIYGNLPLKMLFKLGYSKKMIKKIPTLFCRNALNKLKNYLYLYGIEEITGYFINNKNYFYFKK